MSFFNEKWKNSSILTKVSLWPMMLSSLLLLICTFTLLSWERMLVSQAGIEGSSIGYWIIFLILFLYSALLTFGIFKVNGIARVLTILLGLCSVISVIFLIVGIGYIMSAAREAVGNEVVDAAVAGYSASLGLVGKLFTSVIIPLIPASVLARIGIYLFIFTATPFLQVLSMLILLFCKKDFKKRKDGKTQSAAS
jgi:hypothetical protein